MSEEDETEDESIAGCTKEHFLTAKSRVRTDNKNRMKIHINLDQEQSNAFKNFYDMVGNPHGEGEGGLNQFALEMLFAGMSSVHQSLANFADSLEGKSDEEREALMAEAGLQVPVKEVPPVL